MEHTLDSSSVNALVFSGGEVWREGELDVQANAILQIPAQSASSPSESSHLDGEQNVSTYVRVFEDMVSTVIREETHLLNDEEFALLTVFAHLSYNARFLMVKLLLRKQGAWYRLDALKYEGELGSVSAIADAISELCRVSPVSSNIVKEEFEEREIIDLTMNEGVASPQQEQQPVFKDAGVSEEDRPLMLASDEQEMDLKTLLECLRLDELTAVAKQLKLKTNQNKDNLIKALLGASSSQTTLTNFACSKGVISSKDRGNYQTKLSLRPQQDRLREIALKYIVKCVRVDEEFFSLIRRVNLVYFRLTQYTSDILVDALLTRFGKRSYPGYKYERTKNIWPSRQALLDYEEVLILEAQLDSLLSGNVPPPGGRVAGSETPAPRPLPTPITPGNAKDLREDAKSDAKPDSNRVRGAHMAKDIFERMYPRWKDLVKTDGEEDGRENGLDRFHYGHPLTRIICTGAVVFDILEEYERELEVLEALLAQKRWRRGHRGRWHERRALVLCRYFPKNEENMERALDAVIEALKDPDTHIVYRLKLQRRLRSLENKLKIPVKERHTCDGALAKADRVFFEAVRLRHRAASLKLDKTGRCVDTDASHQRNEDIKRYYSPLTTSVKPEPSSSVAPSPGRKSPMDTPKGKSLWLGQSGEELTVEALALQRYEGQGFKGVHCETRIISMLFGLLFWDIIFESIPGAFETPYQTAPLDIVEDSFYHARKDLMEKRLAAIETGQAPDLIRGVDAKHRASGTWCVGVRWDLFSAEDLVDIVTCIGGQALSVICRVLCEDYKLGTSGGPDLFLWNAENGTCKFVEVKGPGDGLHGTQPIWIDILLRAPVAVEICRVVEPGDGSDRKANTRTPKSTRKKVQKTPRNGEEMDVESEDEDALPTIVVDSSATLEEQPYPTGAYSLLGPVGLRTITFTTTIAPSLEGSCNLSKRKTRPTVASPSTPSKRPRAP